MGLNGSRWLLWSLYGLWCPEIIGTRWNKVDTEYGALRLTNLTILPIPKFTNRDPRWSQKGYYGVLMVSVENFGTSLGPNLGVYVFLKWSEWSLPIPHTLFQPHSILFQTFFGQQRPFIPHIDSFRPILGSPGVQIWVFMDC